MAYKIKYNLEKVDGVYSEYVTYGKWGLGLKNASYDQTKSTIKLVTDEVKVLNSKQATGFKYQIKLQIYYLNM